VSRINKGVVRKSQQLVVEGVVGHGGKLFAGKASGGYQVWAAHVPDERRVAGEDGLGLFRATL
jgi:hypothetical protein